MSAVTFKGRGKRLDDIDLPRIGATIGVGEDELHAFMEVEAAGAGFDGDGRIKMLFEPHIFWRELGPGKKRDVAAKAGLAYPKWKRSYPANSYTRLNAAITLDKTAALRSASWGLGQVMGFNHLKAGYSNVEAMINAFADDEENHVKAIVAFLVASKLDDNLRTHDWRGVENGYNGGGFKGAYAEKMVKAFARWRKIKDTPYDPKIHGVASYLPGREKKPTDAVGRSLAKPVLSAQPPESGGIPVSKSGAAGAAVVVGAATAAQQSGLDWKIIGGVLLVALVVGVLFFKRSRT